MKPRYADFLSDREHAALISTQTDRKLYTIGVVSLMTMCVISLGFISF